MGEAPSVWGVWLAGIATVQVVLLALVTHIMQARQRRQEAEIKAREKAEDYARQDVVAERVATAADNLLAVQTAALARADEAARLKAETDKYVADQLRVVYEQGKAIHILVNNDMTLALIGTRNALRLLLISLRNVMAQPAAVPDEASRLEILRVESKVVELDQILEARRVAQTIVDAETARSAARAIEANATQIAPTTATKPEGVSE